MTATATAAARNPRPSKPVGLSSPHGMTTERDSPREILVTSAAAAAASDPRMGFEIQATAAPQNLGSLKHV